MQLVLYSTFATSANQTYQHRLALGLTRIELLLLGRHLASLPFPSSFLFSSLFISRLLHFPDDLCLKTMLLLENPKLGLQHRHSPCPKSKPDGPRSIRRLQILFCYSDQILFCDSDHSLKLV